MFALPARRLTVLLAALACGCGGASTATRSAAEVAPRRAPPAERPEPLAPQLVVGVVIDQLGSDALRKLEPLLAPDGLLAHARAHGLVYEHVVYPYAATLTAPGHAAIYSGAAPARSGVTTNYLVDRATGKRRAIVDDGSHTVIGVPDKFAAPGALRVDTVADSLKAATQGRGKVVSLSLKDRSAILPAGRRPDLVLWYESALPGFTSSTYYTNALPPWLAAYQAAHPIAPAGLTWNAEEPARLLELLGPDAAPGEGQYKGLGTSFPHALAQSSEPNEAWVVTPASADALLALALEAVEQLALGQDDDPDLLAISISGTDYAGHVFGPDSWEYADHLRHVDRALMRLLEQLQRQTRVAMLITSDHGAAPLPESVKAAHPSAARIDPAALARRLDRVVDAAVGAGDWVSGLVDGYVFLTPAARGHAASAQIRAAVIASLRAEPGVALAYDTAGSEPPPALDGIGEAVLRSINPETSGDVYVVTTEYSFLDVGISPGAGTTHGSPWPYDRNVPVLLLAPGLTPARHPEPLDELRVASTLAALLAAPPPLPDAPPPLPGLR